MKNIKYIVLVLLAIACSVYSAHTSSEAVKEASSKYDKIVLPEDHKQHLCKMENELQDLLSKVTVMRMAPSLDLEELTYDYADVVESAGFIHSELLREGLEIIELNKADVNPTTK